MEELGYAEGYKYAHDYPEGYVPQEYLGVDKTYYRPTDRGKEAVFKAYLEKLAKIREETRAAAPPEGPPAAPAASRSSRPQPDR